MTPKNKVAYDVNSKRWNILIWQVCLDLVRHSVEVASGFFESQNLVLVPNCSIGMKSILERLVKKNKGLTVAYLSPVYGATQKLLKVFQKEGALKEVIAITPGSNISISIQCREKSLQ